MDFEYDSDYSGSDVDLPEQYAGEKEKNYTVLKEEDIRRLQESHISTVCSLLSVSRSFACTLLCRRNWRLNSFDDWIPDDEKFSQPAETTVKQNSLVCNICFEDLSQENMESAVCRHFFCVYCMTTYISTSINDGSGCLTLRCPEPQCDAVVGLDMVEKLVSEADKAKYYRFLCRSYVESDGNRKWCPAPGCDFAIELDGFVEEFYDVICGCNHRFCWNCTQDSHRPVDCATVAKWLEKNTSEAENIKWIMAYTKPCPNEQCRKPIEKNQGCNHMRCSQCKTEYCWICLGDWKNHKSYDCHKFKDNNAEDNEDNKNIKKVRNELERYKHYYERWASNNKSRKMALVDLERAKNEHIVKLSEVQGDNYEILKFVGEAWEQIVECRRVLTWTYAYGYYLEEKGSKRNFFEYLQGEAEAALERLHYCAEKEMDKYLHSFSMDFKDFQSRLCCLTQVTKNYFENLVRALENNLSEVESSGNQTKRKRSDKGNSSTSEARRGNK